MDASVAARQVVPSHLFSSLLLCVFGPSICSADPGPALVPLLHDGRVCVGRKRRIAARVGSRGGRAAEAGPGTALKGRRPCSFVMSDSPTPVAAYLIETSCFEAAAAVSLVFAVLLLASSMPRVSAQPVASSKRFFHAVVTLCACLVRRTNKHILAQTSACSGEFERPTPDASEFDGDACIEGGAHDATPDASSAHLKTRCPPSFAAIAGLLSLLSFLSVCSLLCSLLSAPQNLVKSIDNHQVFRRFSSDAYIVIFLTNNITPSLMLGGAVLIYNTIDVQYRINKSSTPRLLPALLAALSGSNFVVINTFTALAVIRLQQRYFLYLLWYLIVSFTVLLIIADISVANVRALILKYQDRSAQLSTASSTSSPGSHSRAHSKVLAAEKSLYPLYGFVIFLNVLLLAVVAALLYQAITILHDHLQDRAPDRADPQEWQLDIFAWVHVVAIWLFIWWSWVPLVIVKRAMRKMGYGASETESNIQMLNKDSGAERDGGHASAATHRATTTLHSAAGGAGGGAGNGSARGFHHAHPSGQILVQPRSSNHPDSARLSNANGNGLGSARGNGLNSPRGNGLGSARGNGGGGLGSARAHHTKPGEVISSARGSGSMGRVYERGLAATGRQAIGTPVRTSNGVGLTPRTGDTLGPPDSTLLLTPSPRGGAGQRTSSDAAALALGASPSTTLLPGQSSTALLNGNGHGGGTHSTTEKESLFNGGHSSTTAAGGVGTGGPPDMNRALSVNVSSKTSSQASTNNLHGGSRAGGVGSGGGGVGGGASTLAPREQAPSARFSARHTNDLAELSVSREGDGPGAGRLSERNSPVHAPSPSPLAALLPASSVASTSSAARGDHTTLLFSSPTSGSASSSVFAAAGSPSATSHAAQPSQLPGSPSMHLKQGSNGGGGGGGHKPKNSR